MSQLEQQFEGLFSDEDRKALQRAAELLGLSFSELVSQRNPHTSRRHDPNAASGSVVPSTTSTSSDATTPVDMTTPTQLLWPTLTWSPGIEYPVRSGASLIAPNNGSYIDLPIWPNEPLNWQNLLQAHSYAPDVGLDFGTEGFTLEKGLFEGNVNSLSAPNDISLSPWYMVADLGAGASFETIHSRTSTKFTPIDDLAIVQSIALAAGGLGYLDAAAELGRASGHTQPQSSLLPANTPSLLDESDSVDLTSLLTPFPDQPRLMPQVTSSDTPMPATSLSRFRPTKSLHHSRNILPKPPSMQRGLTGRESNNSAVKKRRKAFSPEKRQETHDTRKVGACIRCRMQRGRVWFPSIES